MPLPPDFRPAHLTNTYVCSGHGIWDPSFGKFITPPNVTVIFWVHHGEALINGTAIEDLLTTVNETKLGRAPEKQYNLNPRKLATDATLASFRSPVNTQLDVPPRPRFNLPEVIPPYSECFNYELSFDINIAMYLLAATSRLRDAYGNYPVENLIQADRDHPKRLADILHERFTNASDPVHVHWAACRALSSMV